MSTTKGPRRQWLAQSREAINQLPLNELFELPGRPHVVYQIRSYAGGNPSLAENARADMPFLFKAFETGQIGPKRMAKMHGGKPRVATIHEYLDWTITAQSSTEDDELVSTGEAQQKEQMHLGVPLLAAGRGQVSYQQNRPRPNGPSLGWPRPTTEAQ